MFKLGLNQAAPEVMHVDLNSCFAMVEQQANPLLRGRPVGVTNRLVKNSILIAASYEAKAHGIGVGTTAEQARAICPDIVIVETDPPKYIHTYRTFFNILKSYSPDAQMKSVDEGVIDFKGTRVVNSRPLTEIGLEIKQRLQQDLGEWMTCNIGIAPNRWLAKLAAGLNKPNGMDVITHHNLASTYGKLELLDFPGINRRYKARLNLAQIFTPTDFFAADEWNLTKEVFYSILGHLWYARMRGWEVDNYPTAIRSVGKQYVLPPKVRGNERELGSILVKMCEMMGRRLRGKGLAAHGIFVGCWMEVGEFWHARSKYKAKLYATQDLARRAFELFNQRPSGKIRTISVTCYSLTPAETSQQQLFETDDVRRVRLSKFIDSLNDRYGEFSVMPGSMANSKSYVAEKIPFGSTRYFEYKH